MELDSSRHYVPSSSKKMGNSSSEFIERFSHRFKLNLDDNLSYRQKKLIILQKFLDRSIYDNLYPFYMEFTGDDKAGQYIRLSKRRPSVTYNLCKIIVEDSVSLLFGDDHFPVVRCAEYKNTEQFLQIITRESNLRKVMLDAARAGSIGSACIAVKLLEGKFHFEVLETYNLTPFFKKLFPEQLERVIEKVKVDGSTLQSYGYAINKDDLNKFFYVTREWNEVEEIFYIPYLCEKEKEDSFVPSKDEDKSELHDLGFVPLIWIRNLPSTRSIDGDCTFESIIDINIEIEYHLSQLGRTITYNEDPTLVIKNPSAFEGEKLIKSISVLNLDEKGDAYYAEMSGKSVEPAMGYIRLLREYALEVARGNRTSPEKISTAQSGKAIQMLNAALISMVSEMRVTYGDEGVLKLYKMILAIANHEKMAIDYDNVKPDSLKNIEDFVILDWPAWYPLSSQEKLQEAQTLSTYKQNNILSTETAVTSIADEYNILDIPEELKTIEKEKAQEYTLSTNNKTLNNKDDSNE